MKWLPVTLAIALFVWGCGGQQESHDDDHEHESWSVTVWGEHFEIFAETDALVAGQIAMSHVHVTDLNDFSALQEGTVEMVLRAADGSETTYRRDEALRAGIFQIEIKPSVEGAFDLLFRVDDRGWSEEIAAGRVSVGNASAPGGPIASHSHEGAASHDDHNENRNVGGAAQAISFLKEQQWRTAFSTEWAFEGTVHHVARGPGHLRTVAGGEVILTAPLGGVVVAELWPYVGLDIARGAVLLELTPRVATGRSLAEIEARHTEKEAALNLAEDRLARLEQLLPLEAVSRAEVETARSLVTTLRAQHAAAAGDLAAAQVGHQGSQKNPSRAPVVAPFSGQIAEVLVRPGEVVAAGEALARLVRVEPLWVEVFLQPDKVEMLTGEPVGLSIRGSNDEAPTSFGPDQVRLVSCSPEVSRRTHTVTCIFEISGTVEKHRLGSTVETEVFLPKTEHGIVIPTTAVVDDGGVPVVYIQLDGESFARQEIAVRMRQGSSLLVDGLTLGQRLVTLGGAAIRRSTLISSGVGEGHVH